MNAIGQANFWSRTAVPARPALLATLVVLVVGLVSFVALVWAESAYFGLSPVAVIMAPPGPGAPVVWLGTVLLAVAFQGLATLALRQRATLLRVLGAVTAAAIALLCLAFLVSAVFSFVDYVTAGELPGDFGDLLGILLFGVPLALVIGGLNARAFLLELRELFR
jgi:hypothetical protein